MIPTRRYVLFAVIAAGGCALDLATKRWIFSWADGPGKRGEWWLVENFIGIQKAVNEGALFGMGQGYSTLFATFSIAALVGIVLWLFVFRAAQDRILTYALASICGGILGNLYDRLGLWGGIGRDGLPIHGVRDWILLCYYDRVWPNFNLADALLVCGAALLAFHALRPVPKLGAEPTPSAESPAARSSQAA